MDYKLELIVIPVTDMARAKAFYSERVGFHVDVDHRAGEDFRIIQLTPAGSACSITLIRNPERAGAVHGLHLVVKDIEAARADLASRDVDVSEPFHFSPLGQTPGLDPNRRDYGSFASFNDPYGNSWQVQEVKRDAPARPRHRPRGKSEPSNSIAYDSSRFSPLRPPRPAALLTEPKSRPRAGQARTVRQEKNCPLRDLP